MWKMSQFANKSQSRNKGPFKIKSVLADNKYELESHNDTFLAPANFLKKIKLKDREELYDETEEEIEMPEQDRDDL
jgi:hypothetical protein